MAHNNNNNDNDNDNDARLNSAVSLLQKRYRGYRKDREAAGLNLETSNASAHTSGRQQQQQQQPNGDSSHSNSHSARSNSRSGSSRDGGQEGSKDSPLSPDTRWNEAFHQGGLSAASREQAEGKNDAKSRWQRTGFYAERVSGTDGSKKGKKENDDGQDGDGDDDDGGGDVQAKSKALAPNKQMEAQYWLEIVDSKHRYGTNLKSYHDAWNKSDTSQNFFYWLDHGEGKHLDLPACSRAQLDAEQVVYLTAEQRKNYLIDVGGSDGLLYWHRNGRRVDTAKGRWEDLGDGRGIGYKGESDDLPPPQSASRGGEGGGDESSDDSSGRSSLYSSSDSGAEAAGEGVDGFKQRHYHQKPDSGESRHSYWTSPRALMDVLLRKTINANTWIYVCTTEGQLYVGIKATGGFQHSSFLRGATIASAGLIKARNGQLTSLSPLSGHYRAGTAHFKAFTKTLRDKGVDMSNVSTSKSLVVIGGIEQYGKLSKKKKHVKRTIREKLHLRPNKAERAEEREQERNKQIEEEARQKEQQQRHSSPTTDSDQNGHATGGGGGEDAGAVEGDMHNDKDVKDLTDHERAERAIALVRSAIGKGLKGQKKEIERDARKDTPAADGDSSAPSDGKQEQPVRMHGQTQTDEQARRKD